MAIRNLEKINAMLSAATFIFVVNTEHRLTAIETKLVDQHTIERPEKYKMCFATNKDSFAAPRRFGACSDKLVSPPVMAARGDK